MNINETWTRTGISGLVFLKKERERNRTNIALSPKYVLLVVHKIILVNEKIFAKSVTSCI